MPRHFHGVNVRERRVEHDFHGVVGFNDGVQAVELVGEGGGEDGVVGVVVDGVGEVVVLAGVFDLDVA